jgi:hypothetical protein
MWFFLSVRVPRSAGDVIHCLRTCARDDAAGDALSTRVRCKFIRPWR